jgi:hypothetical protein
MAFLWLRLDGAVVFQKAADAISGEGFMRLAIAALVGLGLMQSAEARGPYGLIKVAGWSGGAFTDDNTGEFSNCIASASYKSGINFGVLVSKTYNWVLAFTHPSWALAPVRSSRSF